MGALNLGTFTGAIITDNTTIKTALQELETVVDNLPVTKLDIDGANAGSLTANSLFIADENGAGTNTKVTAAAVANYVASTKTIKDMSSLGTGFDTEPTNYYFLAVDASTGNIVVLNKQFVETEGSP